MGDRPARPAGRSKWAPWWVYVVLLLAANALRQAIVPFGTVPEWANAVLAVTVAAALFVFITAAHRARAGR